jgi:hypothetical protein
MLMLGILAATAAVLLAMFGGVAWQRRRAARREPPLVDGMAWVPGPCTVTPEEPDVED